MKNNTLLKMLLSKHFVFVYSLMLLYSTVGYSQGSNKAKSEGGINQISGFASNESSVDKTLLKVIANEDGAKTIVINDSHLKTELLNNREKRDLITALPGFISLSIEGPEVKVTIRNEYIQKYMVEYLGFKTQDVSSL